MEQSGFLRANRRRGLLLFWLSGVKLRLVKSVSGRTNLERADLVRNGSNAKCRRRFGFSYDQSLLVIIRLPIQSAAGILVERDSVDGGARQMGLV